MHWQVFRKKRNKLLQESDYTMLGDVPLSTKERGLWKRYREYLRNAPAMHDSESVKTAEPMSFAEWKEHVR